MKDIIQIKNLSKNYEKIVLKNINFTIQEGEKIAIVGPNGSGKSTLGEIIAEIRKPSKGKILIDKKIAVGIQFQDTRFPFGITVNDMIRYYLQSFNIEMNAKELFDLLITYQIDEFQDKMISDLSGGQQQRLNILLAMIHKPKVIVLDEISTGLDIQVREEIFQFIQKEIIPKGIAIILVTHMMDEVERFCDRLILINNGEIVDDQSVSQIIAKHQKVQKYIEKKLAIFKSKENIQNNKLTEKNVYKKPFNKKTKNNNKSLGLFNLVSKYFIRNKVIPFYIILYPIISLFLVGRAIQFLTPDLPYDQKLLYIRTLIIGVAIVQILSIGIFVMPEMIIEFKKSVLLKRIGATGIKPLSFNITIINIGFLLTLISYVWSALWSGIIFGFEWGWSNVLLIDRIFQGIPFLILLLISSTAFGLMIAAFFKTSSAFLGAANLIYIIIAILSGGFVPLAIIEKSEILKGLMYINPFQYIIGPYWDIMLNRFQFDWKFFVFLSVGLSLIAIYSYVGIKNLKWQA